jgi:hypothetical protein
MTPCCGEISKNIDMHAKRPSAGPKSPQMSASVSEDAGCWRAGCGGCHRMHTGAVFTRLDYYAAGPSVK